MKVSAIAVVTLVIIVLLTGCHFSKLPSGQTVDLPGQPVKSESRQKLLLVTSEYAPYTSELLPGRGFFVQIVDAVIRETGMEYEIRFYPWARCEEMVRNGEAWATFPYSFSEKRAKVYLFTEPILSSYHRFFYLKENDLLVEKEPELKTLLDFREYKIGGANGYWYGEQKDLQSQGFKDVEWADDIYGLVRMLYSRRLDFFIEDELVGWNVVHHLYRGEENKFATSVNVAREQEYHLLVSKNHPRSQEMLNKFNATLLQLKRQGKIDEIAAQYMVK